MSLADIVRMANQIARAFASEPRKVEETANHIKSFWTRSMIEELRACAAADASKLDPVVIEAIKLLPTKAAA